MKKYFAFAAIACAALVSCQKETAKVDEIPSAPVREGYVELTLSATCDAQTKAVLDGNTVVWAVGDEVAVYAGDATAPEKFTVSAVDFDAVKFTGSVPAGASSFIAVYPFKQARGREGNVVDMILPDWQAIPAGGNVCPGALSSVAYFADASSKPQFKNTFSLVEISFSQPEGITTAGAYCDCSDDEYYLGEMKVTVSTSGADPEIVTGLGGFDSTIAPEGGFTAGKSYYIVVPPTPEVKNFGIYANTDSKIARREKSGTFALARNKGISLGDALKDVEWKYSWIINGEQLRDFLAEASTYTADDDVTLGADIDMSGITVVPAASWAGRFSGNGYTIKNWAAPNALFATNSGVVEKVAIDNTCSINWTESVPDQTGIAFVVSKANTGTIRDCQVAGKIKVSTAEAGRIYCAGVVGESTTGLVEGCKFTGSIDVTLSGTSASCSAIAGVAGRVGNKAMTDVSIVKNCTNEGAITFLFSGPSGNMKKFGVGGVVGQTPSVENAPEDHGTIEGCVNKGNISWEYTNGGSGSYPALGGVAGIIEGKIKDCDNYGAIEYKGSKSKAATDPSIGGVAGYVTKGASGCHNYGTITLNAAFAGGTAMAQSGGNTSCAAFGGVFGCAGDFATGELISGTKDKGTLFAPPVPTEVLVENCSNEAALSLTPVMISSGGPKFLIGGVVGASTANIKDCDNTKDISIVSQPRWIVAGGIAGLCTGNMTSCTNSGVFAVDADKDNHPSGVVQQHYIGGLVGYIWKGAVIDDCHNAEAVSLVNIFTTPGTLSYLGGLIGSYSGGITMSNCSNSGSVTYDAQNPICLGGVAGAFNGVMTGTSNSGAVDNKSSYTASGKEAEVGGLVGYANAEFNGCSNSGSVSSASPDGATGGFVGGFGEANKTWSDCTSDAPVSGPNAGSIFGWFRKDTEYTITLGADGAPFTVSANATVNGAAPTAANIVGNIKSGKTDNVNLVIAGTKVE